MELLQVLLIVVLFLHIEVVQAADAECPKNKVRSWLKGKPYVSKYAMYQNEPADPNAPPVEIFTFPPLTPSIVDPDTTTTTTVPTTSKTTTTTVPTTSKTTTTTVPTTSKTTTTTVPTTSKTTTTTTLAPTTTTKKTTTSTTSAPTTTKKSTAAPSKPIYPANAQKYQIEYLELVNSFRAKHSAPPLIWDQKLTNLALKCAKYYAGIQKIDHTCPDNKATAYGENLDAAVKAEKNFLQRLRNQYAEGDTYDYDNPPSSLPRGQFTQLVWQSSTKFGFGTARPPSGSRPNNYLTIGVAFFDPPGNVDGEFNKNVLPN